MIDVFYPVAVFVKVKKINKKLITNHLFMRQKQSFVKIVLSLCFSFGFPFILAKPVSKKNQEIVKQNLFCIPGHDPLNLKVMTLFASGKAGRLVGRSISVGDFYQITTKEKCASMCNGLHATKCLSFNYDFGSSGHCELLEAIEGHDHKISHVSI